MLFEVQPLIGKYVLPRFGGSPEVWTTCMLFFQMLLLAGYAYAHLSVRFLRPRVQAILHLVLLLAALAVLPLAPEARWQPSHTGNPTLQIMLLLTMTIGLPFFVLASTSPLMQGWLARSRPDAQPYRLYALSNAGSLLALVSYPLLIEPVLSRQQQSVIWSLAWSGFAILSGLCAARLWSQSKNPSLPATDTSEVNRSSPRPRAETRLLWLALPAGASVVLLAVTNKICLDLAAVPFLWVLPLGLYLLSFIICFDNQRWYSRRPFLATFILCIIAVIYLRTHETAVAIWIQTAIYLAAMFVCCMVCHGELFRLRPQPRHLTSYYLMIAAGGALGGFTVAVVAPLVFRTYLELYLGLLACCLFALLADPSPAVRRRRWLWVAVAAIGTVAVVLTGSRGQPGDILDTQLRNFYGVLTLWEKYPHDPQRHRYVLQHGTTFHGLQFADPQRRRLPTAYYGPESGGGLAIEHFPRKTHRRIGVVGLGVGTLAAYGKAGDVFRFYEINPAVKHLAETRFSYLSDSPADVEVVMGDGRLSLEREPPQHYDVLVLDAFTSGAIPVHLLTREAFEIHLRHLKDDGVLAVHVSNYHLDLKPVLFKLAEHFRLQAVWISAAGNDQRGTLTCDWVLLTNNAEFLNVSRIRFAALSSKVNFQRTRLWTDDHVSLLDVLAWQGASAD